MPTLPADVMRIRSTPSEFAPVRNWMAVGTLPADTAPSTANRRRAVLMKLAPSNGVAKRLPMLSPLCTAAPARCFLKKNRAELLSALACSLIIPRTKLVVEVATCRLVAGAGVPVPTLFVGGGLG